MNHHHTRVATSEARRDPTPGNQRGSTRRTTAGLASTVLAASVVVGLVAGCGGGSSGGSSSSSVAGANSGKIASGAGGFAAGAPETAPKPGAAVGAPASGDTGTTKSSAASAVDLLQSRRLILNTNINVTVTNVFNAAARVRSMASAAGGYIGDEKTAGSGATAQSALTLRVPQAQIEPITDQVATLGKVTERSQSSQDVTQQSVDVASRVATQKASVARIRALLAQATKITDIIAIEGELAQREADLESLEAQLKSLDDQVDLATLSVVLSAPGAPATTKKHDTGFGVGLHHGWDAFVGALAVGLTVVGALLPFAVLLVVLGGPALLLWRRRHTGVPPAATPMAYPEA